VGQSGAACTSFVSSGSDAFFAGACGINSDASTAVWMVVN
jgi:hypothetical protein